MAIRIYNGAELKSDLYGRIPSDGEFELLIGENSIGDTLPSLWRYNASSAAADNYAGGVIQPTLQTGNGRWLRIAIYASKDWADTAMATLQSDINGKFAEPTGNNTQYLDGAGTPTTFPTIPSAPVNADWNAGTGLAQILNKPSIPAAQVNCDWNSVAGVSQLLNKPSLSTVATSGSYNDLSNKPSIPSAQVNSDWNSVSGVSQILNKPSLATVATSGSYNDLTNKPTIPTIPTPSYTNNPSVTIQTVAAAGNGNQLSSTRMAFVNYSVTINTIVSLSGNSNGYVVLEIAATNSSTAGDWTEIGRTPSGQSGTIVVGLVLNQIGGGQVGGIVPAGYYRRLRSVNTSGTPSYTYNSGQEVLY